MGDISIKGRSPLVKGGRVGFRKGGYSISTTKLKRGADQEFTLQKGVSAAPIKQQTIYKLKKHVDISRYKSPHKKASLAKKFDVAANRASAKIFSQASSGVNIKFHPSGKPYVPKGEKSSMLTKAKGWSKLAAVPAASTTTLPGTKKKKDKDKE